MVCCQNLLFLLLGVPSLRFEYTAFATVFAPVLLAPAGIVTVFYEVLASTCSTSVDNEFCDHILNILLITSISPLPLFFLIIVMVCPTNLGALAILAVLLVISFGGRSDIVYGMSSFDKTFGA